LAALFYLCSPIVAAFFEGMILYEDVGAKCCLLAFSAGLGALRLFSMFPYLD
jgi:hypothetical protein